MKARLAALLNLQISLVAFKCSYTFRKYRLVLLQQLILFMLHDPVQYLAKLKGFDFTPVQPVTPKQCWPWCVNHL